MAYAFRLKRPVVFLFIFGVLLVLSWGAAARTSAFRDEFINNYVTNRFQQQVILVKAKREIIPDEVKALIGEAMAEGRPFEHRMKLLDIAQAMATMHKYWNNDESPLAQVEVLIKMEIAKEEQRRAEREKWTKYEKFIGNFIMKEHEPQMEAAGLAPVIYPHWSHRIWFECKVCHQGIFKMKRGANDISQGHIIEGSQCGVCHNNGMAFGADKAGDCVRCHMAGRPEADHLYDTENVDHRKLKEVAVRIGAEWNHEKLPDGKIPIDRFGNIDWLELKALKVFDPVVSLDPGAKDEIRDNRILFEANSSVLNNVLFSHNVHSAWIRCDTCHPAFFKDELGGNDIKMSDMARGEFCGLCHGKVSFSFADCLRCHNQPKGTSLDGVLIHRLKH